jgi:hypothetical protein
MNGQDSEMERESSMLADLLAYDVPARARPGLLDDVLARTRTTPQLAPRPWWRGAALERPRPRGVLRFALAGALVVVVGSGLAVGASLSTGRGPFAGGNGTSGPSVAPASPSAGTPDPSPRPAWVTDQWNSTLDPGVPYYFDLPTRVTFKVPAGWSYAYTRDFGSVIANDLQTAAVGWFVTENLFRDACHWQQGALEPPVGPGVDDLVTALEKVPGFVVAGPTSETIGGLPATTLALVMSADEAACDGSQLKVFIEEPTGGTSLKGGTMTVRVVDAGGTRLMVVSWTKLLAGADAASDVESIVRSVRFE